MEFGVGGHGSSHFYRRGRARHLLTAFGREGVQVLTRRWLIGVAQQLPGPAGQRVAGGLVAADQQRGPR